MVQGVHEKTMEHEKEVLQQISDLYDDLDQDLIDIVGIILEKKPSPKLERMWRGYMEYCDAVGSDSVLFNELMQAAWIHIF